VRAFFAGGNGGQLVISIPDLDLVVAIYAGNYSDPCSTRSKKNSYPSTFCPRSMLKNRFDFRMRQSVVASRNSTHSVTRVHRVKFSNRATIAYLVIF
jgi:hypothetical protein